MFDLNAILSISRNGNNIDKSNPLRKCKHLSDLLRVSLLESSYHVRDSNKILLFPEEHHFFKCFNSLKT